MRRSAKKLVDASTQTDEIDVDDGGLIQLTEGPNGGRRYGEGWWEGTYLGFGAEAPCHYCCCPSRCPGLMGLLIAISGIDASGKQGIFPSNYVSARSDKSREAACTEAPEWTQVEDVQ